MASASAKINFMVKAFVDRAGVMRKIGKWKLGQLGRVGAYARGAMKKQIRPALKGTRKSRTILIPPAHFLRPVRWKGQFPFRLVVVQENGFVIDAKTGAPVSKAIAIFARHEYALKTKGRGEGKPPRKRAWLSVQSRLQSNHRCEAELVCPSF
jgi:hypothetical protein